MIDPLQSLVESLRNELQQYGEMLALLEQQRQAVLCQSADCILHHMSAINAQNHLLVKAREMSQLAFIRLARTLNPRDETDLSSLIPILPEHLRPLVTALIQENNALLFRIRQRAQQNQCSLQISLDHMRRFIDQLSPEDPTGMRFENASSNSYQSAGADFLAIA